jgi:hypothetical protein
VCNVLELSTQKHLSALNAPQAKLSQMILKSVLHVPELSQTMFAPLAPQAKLP